MRRTAIFLPALIVATAACGPGRSFIDETPMDAGHETSVDVFSDAADAHDGESGMDAGCIAADCIAMCTGQGFPSGTCTGAGVCTCTGEQDAGPDVVDVHDSGRDVTMESGVIGCASNADCPATTYCNGAGCSGTGFCSPRTDPGSCGAGGPPECGCDNMWYTNNCIRQAMGARLNSNPTACGPVPDAGIVDAGSGG